MPRTLSEEILTLLDGRGGAPGHVSIAHLARTFGVSSQLVRSCATQLVADGTAVPFMAEHGGVPVIQGLLPRRS